MRCIGDGENLQSLAAVPPILRKTNDPTARSSASLTLGTFNTLLFILDSVVITFIINIYLFFIVTRLRELVAGALAAVRAAAALQAQVARAALLLPLVPV